MSKVREFGNESEKKINSDELDREFEKMEKELIDIPEDFELDLPKTYLDLPDFELDVDLPGKKKHLKR
ncbi:hypothetical protein SAMN05444280_12241 [Tangfeifania diversioriginum]|uniref:Uncharacterized protein n=1 Tax=Tangfeifania diversioriginum TaxID=1168035 RepID=A0A1M6K560_9BACT|nr:hypothetical protein [Tangfeifania diversioriginum]SHJ54101.1 hypothetical protein SAMN05444280_12241 [Tangfeifania diversioriginum]